MSEEGCYVFLASRLRTGFAFEWGGDLTRGFILVGHDSRVTDFGQQQRPSKYATK